MFGLRDLELSAAERLRTAGHDVITPDLFAGATVDGDLEEGFALMDRTGWSTIVARARRTTIDVPPDAVLGGFSMGVGVISELWPERLRARAVFCLHAPPIVPIGIPRDTPIQLHVGENDAQFAPPDQVAAFRAGAASARARADVHLYRDAGHLFTDGTLPDHSVAATDRTWRRVLTMLADREGSP